MARVVWDAVNTSVRMLIAFSDMPAQRQEIEREIKALDGHFSRLSLPEKEPDSHTLFPINPINPKNPKTLNPKTHTWKGGGVLIRGEEYARSLV